SGVRAGIGRDRQRDYAQRDQRLSRSRVDILPQQRLRLVKFTRYDSGRSAIFTTLGLQSRRWWSNRERQGLLLRLSRKNPRESYFELRVSDRHAADCQRL